MGDAQQFEASKGSTKMLHWRFIFLPKPYLCRIIIKRLKTSEGFYTKQTLGHFVYNAIVP